MLAEPSYAETVLARQLSPEAVAEHGLADSIVPPRPARHGPRLPARTLLSLVTRNLLAGFRTRDFTSFYGHSKFFGTRIHVSTHPDGVRHALHHQHAIFHRKSPSQRFVLRPLLGDGLFVSDGPTWAERRAIVGRIVHARHTRRFAPVMEEAAREQVEGWARACATTGRTEQDILAEMGALTAEIIARTIFGASVGRDGAREIAEGFLDYAAAAATVDLPTMLGVPDWMPRPRSRRLRRARDRVQAPIAALLSEARRRDDPCAPVAQLLAAKDRHGRPLTPRAVFNEAVVIFMAGQETTASTLAWAIYLVSQCRRTRAKLDGEFAAVLNGRQPTLADVDRLRFTRAVIEETLRLYPPVPILARQASGPGTVGEKMVRRGDLLIVAPWLLHRHEALWTLPDAFVPERFLPEVAARPDKCAYIPFATGPRVCAGLAFALAETSICLASLLQRFEIEPAAGFTVEATCRITLRPSSPLTMVIRDRLRRTDEADRPARNGSAEVGAPTKAAPAAP